MDLYWDERSGSGRDERKREKNLIHAGIGKEQGWIIERDGWRRGHEGVVLGAEEIKELLADARGRPGPGVGHDRAGAAAEARRRCFSEHDSIA